MNNWLKNRKRNWKRDREKWLNGTLEERVWVLGKSILTVALLGPVVMILLAIAVFAAPESILSLLVIAGPILAIIWIIGMATGVFRLW